MWIDFIKVFLVGGLLCAIGQILIDLTKWTPARILVIYVCAGAIFTALGLYEPVIKFGKCGATLPLTGFGYALSKGVIRAVQNNGWLGVISGGLEATSLGISSAIFFGYFFALISRPKNKK